MNTIKSTSLELTKFTRKKQQPNEDERINLRYRLYNFSNMNRIAKVFKRTQQQVQQAFAGKQPTLMNKIKIYIERKELNQKKKKNKNEE